MFKINKKQQANKQVFVVAALAGSFCPSMDMQTGD